MASKEAFLDQIARKLGRSRVYEVEKPQWQSHPWDHLHQGLDHVQLVELFTEELIKLGGEVIRVSTLEELPRAIRSWLQKSKVHRMISWDQPTPLGQMVKEALLQARESSTHTDTELQVTFWDEKGDREQLVALAERADVGFTIAEHGLAETGSIVLYNRGNCGRLVSLLPSQSANILLAKDILPRITQALAQLSEKEDQYSCINFITGPSRSADIEMDLSIGVHGPGHIVVFLVEDNSS